MTNSERLAANPPRPTVTKRQRFEQWAARVLLCLALVLGSVGLSKGVQSIRCQNDALGERGQLGAAYDNAVGDVFTVIYLNSKHTITKAEAQKRFYADAATVRHVAEYRNAHPLGKC